MTAPMTFNQFLRHCRRFVDKEIRARLTLPGSQHFSPDEMEAEHRTRRSPDGKDIFAVGLGGKIVESTDRGRRPLLILGLDQSITRTGFALYEYPGEERHMRCGSFSCKDGVDPEQKCELFARQFKRLIGPKDRQPDFIVWERARRRISAYHKNRTPICSAWSRRRAASGWTCFASWMPPRLAVISS